MIEIESLMANPQYTVLLSYFNSSSGVLPIINKLPYNIQEKWTMRAANYKKQYSVPSTCVQRMWFWMYWTHHLIRIPVCFCFWFHLHFPGNDKRTSTNTMEPQRSHGGENSRGDNQHVIANCTSLCDFTGRSCSKTVNEHTLQIVYSLSLNDYLFHSI
jgi:hypothetical protein